MELNRIKQTDNKMLLFMLGLVFFSILAFLSKRNDILQIAEPFLILAILSYFFYKYSKISLALFGFLIFAIIGNISSLISIQTSGANVEEIAYSLGYLCLIYEAIYRIKKLNISVVIGVYLIIVFVINAYFLFILYSVLKETIVNNLELTFVVVRIMSLLLFSLFAFTLYLSSESKQSILLLLMSISLAFSDVLYFVTEYYIYYWLFEILSKALYLVTFYCLYLYVTNYKKLFIRKRKLQQAQ